MAEMSHCPVPKKAGRMRSLGVPPPTSPRKNHIPELSVAGCLAHRTKERQEQQTSNLVYCPLCTSSLITLRELTDHLSVYHKIANAGSRCKIHRQARMQLDVVREQQNLFSVGNNVVKRGAAPAKVSSVKEAGQARREDLSQAKPAPKSRQTRQTEVEKKSRVLLPPPSEKSVSPVEAECQQYCCPECEFKKGSVSLVFDHLVKRHPFSQFDGTVKLKKMTMQVVLEKLPASMIQKYITSSGRSTPEIRDEILNITFAKPEGWRQVEGSEDQEASDDESDEQCTTVEVLDGWTIDSSTELFSPGDLVWARLSRFPWWPAVVTPEPLSSKYFDDKKGQYHVVFLDKFDTLQRGWVAEAEVERFKSKDQKALPKHQLKFKARLHAGFDWIDKTKEWSSLQRKEYFCKKMASH